MAWSEIKKAVNSDISTPLNTLITNLISNAISQVKSYISGAGNVKVVRNVQRGTFTFDVDRTVNISLSGFTNTSKMSVSLYGSAGAFYSSSREYTALPIVGNITTSQLQVSGNAYSGADMTCSYEVIEFY